LHLTVEQGQAGGKIGKMGDLHKKQGMFSVKIRIRVKLWYFTSSCGIMDSKRGISGSCVCLLTWTFQRGTAFVAAFEAKGERVWS